MIFDRQKKIFFYFFSCFFLSHCGLHIWEKAPPVPNYRISASSSGYCSKINYKEEFKAYFFEELGESVDNNSVGKRVERALKCIQSRIIVAKDLIANDHLTKQELISLLNRESIRTENMEAIIDRIINLKHFDESIFIKNNLVDIMKRPSADSVSLENTMCRKQEIGESVLSKQEVDVLVSFLVHLSDFLLVVEQKSYDLKEKFFNTVSKEKFVDTLLEKDFFYQKDSSFAYYAWLFMVSEDFQNRFVSFLSDYFAEDFPEYSQYLKTGLSERTKNLESWLERWGRDIRKLFSRDKVDEILDPLSQAMFFPQVFNSQLNVQNVKYIVLNIYLTQYFFFIYDVNRDFQIDHQELESLSCFLTSLVYVFIAPRLEGQREWIQNLYKPKAISNYIIRYQKFPSIASLSYLSYRIFENPETLENLHYEDVSRLISGFFSEFFKLRPEIIQ